MARVTALNLKKRAASTSRLTGPACQLSIFSRAAEELGGVHRLADDLVLAGEVDQAADDAPAEADAGEADAAEASADETSEEE